ncbi:MAG: hypothetical protein ABJG78_03590 [Cyclobacteriaceae bacterium]
MKNVGSVIYTETENGISAEWVFSENANVTRGTGIGIRLTELNLKKRFEGEYEIVYSDINGIKSPNLKLTISFEMSHYKLRWSTNEKTKDIGIENDTKLSAGWIQIDEDAIW